MAYWTIDFMTRTGRAISIYISGKPGNTNEALTPAADPLYIEEEGNEDLFVPVKTQSGYINIITDNIGMVRSIVPIEGASHSVSVTETVNGTTRALWRGYVEPRMLSFKIWRGKIRVQIPIECQLSALRYQPFATSDKFLTVAQLLYKLTKGFDDVVLQGTFPALTNGDTAYSGSSWLAKKVYTSVFLNEEMNNLEVLENLCTFFGWTCRGGVDSEIDGVQDISVYFIQNRNTDYVGRRDLYVLSQSQLNNATPVGYKIAFVEQAFPQDYLADNSSEMILSAGIKSATASCNINNFNFELDVLDDDFVESEWQQTKVETTTVGTGKPTFYWTQQDMTAGNWRFSGDNIYKGVITYGSNDRKDWEYYLQLLKTAKTDEQHLVPGTSGSMEEDYYQVLTWYEGTLDIDHQVVTEFNSKGTLTINFKQKLENVGFKFYLRIVDGQNVWHYDPSTQTWDAQGNDVECTPVDGKFEAAIPSNFTGEQTTPKGKIQLHLYGVADPTGISSATSNSCIFTAIDFMFEAKTDGTIDSSIKEVEHTASSEASFSETIKFSTLLCVNEPYIEGSFNVLLNADDTPCESLVDSPSPYTTPFNPLQRLVDEAAAEGSNIGEMLKMNIRQEYANEDISPLTVFEIAAFGEMYYPVSISRDFREDVTELKLLKRKYSEEY